MLAYIKHFDDVFGVNFLSFHCNDSQKWSHILTSFCDTMVPFLLLADRNLYFAS